MQKIFQETLTRDQQLCDEYGLSETIMMENAASGIVQLIQSWSLQQQPLSDKKIPKVMIFCGGGNNGADGYAVARMLQGDFEVLVYEVYPAKTTLAKQQKARALKVGIACIAMNQEILSTISWDADIYLDAILGASQTGDISPELRVLIQQLNGAKGLKVACDLPTGLNNFAFKADVTVTMGALKIALFEDSAKDFVGEIRVADLGISRALYEGETDTFLLEAQDLALPFRREEDAHKGHYGFVSVIKGVQAGASILTAKAAMRFGAGITALIGSGEKPIEMMQMLEVPLKTTAIVVGMGLGDHRVDLDTFANYPLVIDADLLGDAAILPLIQEKQDCVLTPHPKEFSQLLALAEIGHYSVTEIQQRRFALAREFSQRFKSVLVLKGANTIIAHNGVIYVSTLGTNHLAKGGSGDVLAGMIAALLAQGVPSLTAAIQAVLAHSLAAKRLNINNYAMTPLDLIEALAVL